MSSFIIRDALGPAVANSNQRLATWRRFKAAWPHTKSLYNERLYYYDNGTVLDTVEFRRFLNIIGMRYEDLENQDYDEIERCWFYLKPPTLKDAIFTTDEMISHMNTDHVRAGDVCKIHFQYGGELHILANDKYEVTNTLDPSGIVNYEQLMAMTPIQIRDAIMLDAGKYVMSQMPRQLLDSRDTYMYVEGDEYSRSVSSSSISETYRKKSISHLYEKPVCQITSDTKYGWYAIFDTGSFTFDTELIGEPKSLPYGEGYGLEWTVTYIAKKDIEATDPCMTNFEPMFNERSELPKVNGSLPFKITEADFRESNEATDPIVWPAGRLSVPGSDNMKRIDFVDMLATCIDSDYEVEDPSFWEKIVAVVIIVAAVVVSILSCGSLAGVAWPAAMAAISFGFAMGAIVLGVGSALLGYFGGPSANSLVKMIGGIAQYVGLISTVLGITAFVGNYVKSFSSKAILKAAKKEAKAAVKSAGGKEAGKVASKKILEEATVLAGSDFYTRATTVMFDSAYSGISFAGNSIAETGKKLSTWLDGAFTIYKNYDQNYGETADIIQENEELADELAKLNEENANSKIMVMGQEVYAYSLGSYDAIAEVNIGIDKQGGDWYTSQDPAAPIT